MKNNYIEIQNLLATITVFNSLFKFYGEMSKM